MATGRGKLPAEHAATPQVGEKRVSGLSGLRIIADCPCLAALRYSAHTVTFDTSVSLGHCARTARERGPKERRKRLLRTPLWTLNSPLPRRGYPSHKEGAFTPRLDPPCFCPCFERHPQNVGKRPLAASKSKSVGGVGCFESLARSPWGGRVREQKLRKWLGCKGLEKGFARGLAFRSSSNPVENGGRKKGGLKGQFLYSTWETINAVFARRAAS